MFNVFTRFASFALTFALLFSLASCEKDDSDLNNGPDPLDAELGSRNFPQVVDVIALGSDSEYSDERAQFSDDELYGFSNHCFHLVYPVEVLMPNGDIDVFTDGISLSDGIRDWLSDNPDRLNPRQLPELIYPTSVQLYDGTIQEMASRSELRMLLQDCRPTLAPLLNVVFPIQVTVEGETYDVENGLWFRVLFARLRTEGKDMSTLQLEYPLLVELSDYSTVVVENAAALRLLRARLRREQSPSACFEIVYPVFLGGGDGIVYEIKSAIELRRALSHANMNGRHDLKEDFVIDFTVIKDGERITIAEYEDWLALLRSCGQDATSTSNDCLRYSYPISFTVNADSDRTLLAENRRQLFAYLRARHRLSIQYPFEASIDVNGTTRTLTIDGPADWRSALQNCQ